MSKRRLPSPVIPFDAVPLAVVEAAKKLFQRFRRGAQSDTRIGSWSAGLGDAHQPASASLDQTW